MLAGFAEKVLGFVDLAAVAPLKVVLDGANGMAGTMLAPILPRLPIQAIALLHGAGRHASRTTSRTRCWRRTARSSSGRCSSEGADLGIAWDGDADRCFFVDDEGEFVPGDFMTALLAEATLEQAPGRDDHLRPARLARRARHRRALRRAGRQVAASATRSSSTACARRSAVFAGEVSGHYYFRDFYGVDTGIVPALLMLELVSRRGGSLAALLRPLRERYHISGEINTPRGRRRR